MFISSHWHFSSQIQFGEMLPISSSLLWGKLLLFPHHALVTRFTVKLRCGMMLPKCLHCTVTSFSPHVFVPIFTSCFTSATLHLRYHARCWWQLMILVTTYWSLMPRESNWVTSCITMRRLLANDHSATSKSLCNSVAMSHVSSSWVEFQPLACSCPA